METSKRIALITGANRGIGFETAKQLAQRGLHIVIAARNPQEANEAASKIQAEGGAASALPLDVSDSDSVRDAGRRFEAIADHLEVLINNAGIYIDKGVDILTVPRDLVIKTFQTNTFGALEVTQVFLPFLRRGSAARVINLSSGYGQLEGMSPDVPSYCLSKLALNGLTIMLAEKLRPEGIAVNSMCPGWVRTDMGGPNATRSIQQGADTAVWLATEASHELTGKFFRDRKEIPW